MTEVHESIIGKKFGKWTVLSESTNRYIFINKKGKLSKAKLHTCQCECGRMQEIRANVLKKELSKSCISCSKIKNISGKKIRTTFSKVPFVSEDWIGKEFNNWTIIKATDLLRKGRAFICRCKCGYEKSLNLSMLLSGRSKSCYSCAAIKRCFGRFHKDPDLTMIGTVFDQWTIIERLEHKYGDNGVKYLCKCVCGATKVYYATALRAGKYSKLCGPHGKSTKISKNYYQYEH